MLKKIIYSILIIIFVGCLGWGPFVSYIAERPKYTIIDLNDDIEHENIEIREYAPMIVAETVVSGKRDKAIGQGFRKIADYIFGNNSLSKDVAMTSPVTQQQNKEIAMTSPVTQQESASDNSWSVRFVMPSSYTMQTLPKPNNEDVKLIEIPRKSFAVIEFSGRATNKDLKEQTQLLEEFIRAKGLNAVSKPTYAFFNPPWTLPILRHNEIMIELEK